MRKSVLATAAILAVTAIWGSTFFVIKDAVGRIDPIDFLVVRFTIGALIPAVLFLGRLSRLTGRQWLVGLGIGVVYGLAQIAQTVGLQSTAASVSGFITGTYVVLTPVVLWVAFRVRVSAGTWAAIALATVGLGVLSLTGLSGVGVGEGLTLLGAALYAVHVVVLDRHASAMDAPALATVQLIGVALTCAVFGVPDGIQLPADGGVWGAVLYTAVLAGIVTMALQTWAQRHLNPARVVLLMTFEPVFASAFAIAFGGESLSWRLLLGGSLVLAATLLGIRAGRPDPAP
ncbi:MAG: DMT family transporter [Arachnia sp.]